MKKVLILLLPVILFSCKKTNDIIEVDSNLNTLIVSERAQSLIVTTSTYQLVSFLVNKGGFTKWGGCNMASAVIKWTATGETNITGYDLEISRSNIFSSLLASYPYQSSNNDNSVNRIHTYLVATNGANIVYYFRLKIYHINSTTSYSQVVAVTLKSPKCTFSGF